jgi:hypothetical protein
MEVHHGRGFSLIRGLSPSDFSAADLTIIYLGIQSYVANQQGQQDEKGNMLGQRDFSMDRQLILTWAFSPYCGQQLFQVYQSAPRTFQLSNCMFIFSSFLTTF